MTSMNSNGGTIHVTGCFPQFTIWNINSSSRSIYIVAKWESDKIRRAAKKNFGKPQLANLSCITTSLAKNNAVGLQGRLQQLLREMNTNWRIYIQIYWHRTDCLTIKSYASAAALRLGLFTAVLSNKLMFHLLYFVTTIGFRTINLHLVNECSHLKQM